MNLPDAPVANEGFFVTHFFTVKDQEKSKDFYVRVLGGKVIKPENPCYIKLANCWIVLNSGGGPTPDKPDVLLETPTDLNRVNSFLNLRVADIWACYKQWRAKGAFFLTEPLDNHGWEWRCYMRDPDGYLIEVGQYTQVALDHFKKYAHEIYPRHTLQDQFKSDGRDTPKLKSMETKLADQQTRNPESKSSTETATRPPLPPFTRETAIQKVRLAEDGWNSRDPEKVALAYTIDSRWRNRAEFPTGRQEIIEFLTRKWAKELDYRLIKELWAHDGNRIAVRFAYEWHDDSGHWYRSYGNENWEFDEHGLMRRRYASINDLPIKESERKYHWPLGRRPDEHPGLSDLGL